MKVGRAIATLFAMPHTPGVGLNICIFDESLQAAPSIVVNLVLDDIFLNTVRQEMQLVVKEAVVIITGMGIVQLLLAPRVHLDR